MRDFVWDFARKHGIRKVKMSQSLKVGKLRRNWGVIEEIPSEIQPLEMGKKEEGAVGMNGAIKPAATEVEANNMACGFVTYDAIPSTAVLILLPRGCLWIRIMTHMSIRSICAKRIIRCIKRRRSVTIKRHRLVKLE